MAVINQPLQDGMIDVIRDKIASVLLDELPNQATLASKPFLNFTQIWKERKTEFNMSELPAINLQVGDIDFGDKFQRQRVFEITYYLDVMTIQKHSTDGFADELAAVQGYSIVNALQYVLDHPEYRALKLEPNVRNVKVQRLPSGEGTLSDGGKCSIIRIEYSVTTHTVDSSTSPIDLEGSDTTVTVGNTDKGFFYKQNF